MRCATIRDQKSFEQFVETLHVEMTSTTNDPLLEPNRDYFVQQWADWFASHGVSGTAGRVFIAEDPKSVGFVAALVSQAPFGSATVPFVGLVGLWWVETQSRGRGLGRQLLLAAEGWFKERGVRYAEANYLAENAGAADRWRRHGFVPYLISARKDLSHGDDAERLER